MTVQVPSNLIPVRVTQLPTPAASPEQLLDGLIVIVYGGVTYKTRIGDLIALGAGAPPYGAFQNNSNVTLAAANTPALIPINSTDYANEMSYASGDGIYVNTAGLYNYQFSIQFANPDNQIHSATVWLRKNGVDVPGTASKFDLIARHGSVDGYVIGACNFYVDLQAGGHIELWWACDSTQPYLEAYPAQVSPYARPSIPSVVATLTYVSPY
jgi:hypothetical protein